jgi:hypothetical protein
MSRHDKFLSRRDVARPLPVYAHLTGHYRINRGKKPRL